MIDLAKLTEQAAAEMKRLQEPATTLALAAMDPGQFHLTLSPESAVLLAAVLQRAQRHPGLQGSGLVLAQSLELAIDRWFAEQRCPAISALIKLGGEPKQEGEVGTQELRKEAT